MKYKRKKIIFTTAFISLLLVGVVVCFQWLSPRYMLERRRIENFTEAQISIIKNEFDLQDSEGIKILKLVYTKNHTLWGYGNENVIVEINGVDFYSFIKEHAYSGEDVSITSYQWKIEGDYTIYANYDAQNGVIQVKKHFICNNDFRKILQDENAIVQYL